jgi:putative Ca2+/H+ antiporter (TMEM165/GDT1 family)
MDWKMVAVTFGTVFLAELGDKTQLAALGMTADSKKPWAVFLGASLALVTVTAIGVAAGGVLQRWMNPSWIRQGSALLFIGIGVWLLVAEFRKGSAP